MRHLVREKRKKILLSHIPKPPYSLILSDLKTVIFLFPWKLLIFYHSQKSLKFVFFPGVINKVPLSMRPVVFFKRQYVSLKMCSLTSPKEKELDSSIELQYYVNHYLGTSSPHLKLNIIKTELSADLRLITLFPRFISFCPSEL